MEDKWEIFDNNSEAKGMTIPMLLWNSFKIFILHPKHIFYLLPLHPVSLPTSPLDHAFHSLLLYSYSEKSKPPMDIHKMGVSSCSKTK